VDKNLVALSATTIADPASAQIQASERATVGQTIDGTTLTLNYSRPLVRGRDLFGGIVPWDVVWTPGANWATTLEVGSDIKLNGVAVPAGEYSVWAIPREDKWLMMLNPEPKIFHFLKPDSTKATVHIPAEAQPGEHTEMLTWSFSQVRGDFAVLEFKWGETTVPLQVEVPPSQAAITDDEIAMYVGTYEMTVAGGPAFPTEATLEVFEEAGKLRGRMSFTLHPADDEVHDLIPMGGSRFNPGLYHDGVFFNVEMGVGYDFTLGADRAEGFKFVAGNGMVMGEGTRIGGQ
jgi:hypothetical protein